MKMSCVFCFFGLFQISKDNCADELLEIRRLDHIFMSFAVSACIVLHSFMRVAPGVTSFEQHSELLSSFIFHHSHSSLLYYLSDLCSSFTFIIFSSFSPFSASLFLNTTCACFICYPTCCLPPTSPLFLLSLLLLLLNGSICSDSSLTASVDHHQLSPPLYCVALFIN